jgi:hypothetical protein
VDPDPVLGLQLSPDSQHRGYHYLPDNSKELILHICVLQGTYYFLFVFYLSWPAWRPAVKWLLGGGPPAPPPQEKKAE